jgi:hypothetical protein
MKQSATGDEKKMRLFWLLVICSGAVGIGLALLDLVWVGWALFGFSLLFRWWRITVPIAGSLLISWSLAQFTPLDSGWISYFFMAAALIGGVLWHRATQRATASDIAR